MEWTKVENPTKDEIKKFNKEFKKTHGYNPRRKPRFFVDENLGQGATQLINQLGGKVTDPWESGMLGFKDDRVWRFALRQRRAILTHDDGTC